PETRLTPVLLVTGLSAVEDRIRGIQAGADDFLRKPVDRNELLARVSSPVASTFTGRRSVLSIPDCFSSSGVTSVPAGNRSRSRRFPAEYSLRKMLVEPRRRGRRLIRRVWH